MSNEIIMEDPESCIGCGWVAPEAQDDQELDVADRWLIIAIPNSVIWLYTCPKCGCAMANKNAVENVKRLKEIKDQRIIHAGSPLVVPGMKGAGN